MTRRRPWKEKLHALLVVFCVLVIFVDQYRKSMRAMDASSFFQEDKSFQPPHHHQVSQQRRKSIVGKDPQQQQQQTNKNQNANAADDDYPPPLEIIPTSKTDKQKLFQQEQQQQAVTAQRMKSIQNFKNSRGFGAALRAKMSGPEHKNKPSYDMVDGKMTLIYKRKYSKVLFFVHIHKSAGTLICHYAYKNKLSASHKTNCNVQEDQRCCGQKDSLQAQINYANKSYYDFVAIEREMYDSMAPDHYDYIACLRNSKARYFSHWGHLRRLVPTDPEKKRTGGFGTAAWLMNDTTAALAALPTGNTNPKPSFYSMLVGGHQKKPKGKDPLGDFQAWYRQQPDNWNTRVFCGPKCMDQAKYQISRELFHYVLQRLDSFRHFVFVENLTDTFNTMASAYGWEAYHDDTTTKNRRHDHKQAAAKLEKQEWDFRMSALDDAIYEFGQRKYRNATREELWKNFTNQADLERYFAEGPTNGCTNACCGNCSLY